MLKVTRATQGSAGVQAPSGHLQDPGPARGSIGQRTLFQIRKGAAHVSYSDSGSQVSPFWPYPHSILCHLLVPPVDCLLEVSREPTTRHPARRPWVAAACVYCSQHQRCAWPSRRAQRRVSPKMLSYGQCGPSSKARLDGGRQGPLRGPGGG